MTGDALKHLQAVEKGTGKKSPYSILQPGPRLAGAPSTGAGRALSVGAGRVPGLRDGAGRALSTGAGRVPGSEHRGWPGAREQQRRSQPVPRPQRSMPAQQKKLLFCTAGLLSLACALGAAAAVGSQLWVRGSILCSTGALLVNASGPELHKFIGAIQYGLFSGQRVRQCGLGGRPLQFSCEYRRRPSCPHPWAAGRGCPSLGHRAPLP